MKHILSLVVLLLVAAPVLLSPMVGSQDVVTWQCVPDNTLYFVGESATVTIIGPPNCFFMLNILSIDANNSRVAFYQETTGPDSNTSIKFEFYENDYKTGTYVFNITYNDVEVAKASVSVVLDKDKLRDIKDERMAEELEQLTNSVNENRDLINEIWRLIKGVFGPMVIAAFCLATLLGMVVGFYVVVPRIRWHRSQQRAKGNTKQNLGRKLDLDTLAVNGIQHPKIPESEYMRYVKALRALGYDDECIDTLFRDETGEFGPTVKLVPVGKVGRFTILKNKGFDAEGKAKKKAEKKVAKALRKADKKVAKALKKAEKKKGAKDDAD